VASFGGATFKIRGTGTSFPRWKRKADSSVTHIPGGNISIIQTSGLTADTLSLVIRCTEAELTALYGKVNTVATLDLGWGSRSAYLDEIGNVDEQLAEQDTFFASLAFVGR
jgi:hypothetical protein